MFTFPFTALPYYTIHHIMQSAVGFDFDSTFSYLEYHLACHCKSLGSSLETGKKTQQKKMLGSISGLTFMASNKNR